jgi:hypothetical protein
MKCSEDTSQSKLFSECTITEARKQGEYTEKKEQHLSRTIANTSIATR